MLRSDSRSQRQLLDEKHDAAQFLAPSSRPPSPDSHAPPPLFIPSSPPSSPLAQDSPGVQRTPPSIPATPGAEPLILGYFCYTENRPTPKPLSAPLLCGLLPAFSVPPSSPPKSNLSLPFSSHPLPPKPPVLARAPRFFTVPSPPSPTTCRTPPPPPVSPAVFTPSLATPLNTFSTSTPTTF